MGTPQSGIVGHVRGWDVGVRVDGRVGPNDSDVFHIYATGGSNNGNGAYLGTVELHDGVPTFVPA